MYYCKDCGSSYKVAYYKEYKEYLCKSCLKINIEHPVNSLPSPGEIKYDMEGRPICHICGRAYNKLMQHARLKHNLNAIEYKKMFGLNLNKGIISKKSKAILRQHVEKNYSNVVENNLLIYGKKSRFQKGHEGRTKDKLSLQALNDLKTRNINNL